MKNILLLVTAMKLKFCKNCSMVYIADDINGMPTCPICNCNEFVVKNIEGKIKCSSCGRTVDINDTGYSIPPFLNIESMTYYCGCKGWD